jgi:hypothetical protein
MIFTWDGVSSDDFGDCHDKIVVASINFIGRQPIFGLYLQEGWFWEPPKRIATPGHHRRSREEIKVSA